MFDVFTSIPKLYKLIRKTTDEVEISNIENSTRWNTLTYKLKNDVKAATAEFLTAFDRLKPLEGIEVDKEQRPKLTEQQKKIGVQLWNYLVEKNKKVLLSSVNVARVVISILTPNLNRSIYTYRKRFSSTIMNLTSNATQIQNSDIKGKDSNKLFGLFVENPIAHSNLYRPLFSEKVFQNSTAFQLLCSFVSGKTSKISFDEITDFNEFDPFNGAPKSIKKMNLENILYALHKLAPLIEDQDLLTGIDILSSTHNNPYILHLIFRSYYLHSCQHPDWSLPPRSPKIPLCEADALLSQMAIRVLFISGTKDFVLNFRLIFELTEKYTFDYNPRTFGKSLLHTLGESGAYKCTDFLLTYNRNTCNHQITFEETKEGRKELDEETHVSLEASTPSRRRQSVPARGSLSITEQKRGNRKSYSNQTYTELVSGTDDGLDKGKELEEGQPLQITVTETEEIGDEEECNEEEKLLKKLRETGLKANKRSQMVTSMPVKKKQVPSLRLDKMSAVPNAPVLVTFAREDKNKQKEKGARTDRSNKKGYSKVTSPKKKGADCEIELDMLHPGPLKGPPSSSDTQLGEGRLEVSLEHFLLLGISRYTLINSSTKHVNTRDISKDCMKEDGGSFPIFCYTVHTIPLDDFAKVREYIGVLLHHDPLMIHSYVTYPQGCKSALCVAIERNSKSLVSLLIEMKASITEFSTWEMKNQFITGTPLHLASSRGYLPIIECLITEGNANPSSLNSDQLEPKDLVSPRNTEVKQYFLSYPNPMSTTTDSTNQ